ncbi:UDP-glucose--hexose-1-phosphate uridylyltransferase [uncultured Croceitalea sp.]|uniref:UDP-glucose--hexose-1-phosphate uridylyltransferase n=1 Tax=uncultured Croceitalea sp. TaxID=1798908 RepID=UPI0033068230
MKDFNERPHRRYNILTGEWILVSPHRTKRPWQGKTEKASTEKRPTYDPNCYLCPTNTRANGAKNEDYKSTFSFKNDFGAILMDAAPQKFEDGLLKSETEIGICKVICFSPDHSLILPLMEVEAIAEVVALWKKEYVELGAMDGINHVQIFENKGAIMGCSNPHPHGQIWAQSTVPEEPRKKAVQQKKHFEKNGTSLVFDYVKQELQQKERVIFENDHFVALVPYWATWPYETIIVPKTHYQHIGQLNEIEAMAFAHAIKEVTTRYDNLFEVSFPYSAGIHQMPTDGKYYPEWHFHMSFYPPLLRSATVKKFMVGYEMFANPQRDITAEQAANTLKSLSNVHYSL